MHSVDQECEAIKSKVANLNRRIQSLEDENARLKSEHYKSAELSKMKEAYDQMRDDYNRGFPITAEQQQAIDNWKANHDCPTRGMKIGSWCSYIFESTPLGDIGTVKCSCGAKFTFQELG